MFYKHEIICLYFSKFSLIFNFVVKNTILIYLFKMLLVSLFILYKFGIQVICLRIVLIAVVFVIVIRFSNFSARDVMPCK